MNITEMINKIVKLKKESEVDLVDCPAALLPGRYAIKNSALQQYLELFKELRSKIPNFAGGIFVTGPKSVEFSEIAEDEGPVITLDTTEMYTIIAENWFKVVGGDQVFSLDCVMPFLDSLNSIKVQLGISQIQNIDFNKFLGLSVKTKEDAINITREAIRGAVGDLLLIFYLNNKLTEKVVQEEWSLAVVPVVLLNATQEEREGELKTIFQNKTITAETTDQSEVTKNEVLIAFKQLNKKMKER